MSIVEKLALNTELEPQAQHSCPEYLRKPGILTTQTQTWEQKKSLADKVSMSGWPGDKSRWGWNAVPNLFGSNACLCRCVPVSAWKNAGTPFNLEDHCQFPKSIQQPVTSQLLTCPCSPQCLSLVELWIRVKPHITLNLSQLSAEAWHSEITTGVCFSDFFGISNILLPSSIWDFDKWPFCLVPTLTRKDIRLHLWQPFLLTWRSSYDHKMKNNLSNYRS